MSHTLYINRTSGIHKREIHEGDNNPAIIPNFDTWLDLKALNIQADYPWVSFDSLNDFMCVPRPYSIISDGKSIPGYFITFKNSALSDSRANFKNYMKICTNNNVTVGPNEFTIFFPESAYHIDNNTISSKYIYVDGPRPTYTSINNPYSVVGFDTWINMSSIGGNHPWVAFNREKDFLSSPPPDIDVTKFSGFAVRFHPSVISDSDHGMKNPVKVEVLNDSITKNLDGSITIIIPRKYYIYMGFPDKNCEWPYFMNLHTWV